MSDVYKVVRVLPDGRKMSAIVSSTTKHSVQYRRGELSIPIIGKLFAFSTKKAAREFAGSFKTANVEVWQSSGTNGTKPTPLRHCSFCWDDWMPIKRFWNNQGTYSRMLTPDKTVGCDQITLKECIATFEDGKETKNA